MTPVQFWDLPNEEQALMIAWYEAKNQMAAYEEQVQQAEMNRSSQQARRPRRG